MREFAMANPWATVIIVVAGLLFLGWLFYLMMR